MALRYKINVLEVLKQKGYSTYTLRKEKIFGESIIQRLRAGEGVSWENLGTLCELLDCQPNDIIEYVKED